jgi:DNA gyrase/topoisomerase IV subunit B
MKTIEKKNKGGAKISKQQVKNHLCIFVNCLVDNPTFDSQTKDNLTTRPKQFKDKKECELSEKFLKQVSKSTIVENVLAFAKYKQSRELKKVGGVKKIKLTGIAKLDDANKAGSAQSSKCTLIITEGDVSMTTLMIRATCFLTSNGLTRNVRSFRPYTVGEVAGHVRAVHRWARLLWRLSSEG